MRRVFIRQEHEDRFNEVGYIIVPFLDSSEVSQLREQYLQLENDLGNGFHATMHSRNVAYRRKVSYLINEVFKPKADKVLQDYRHLVSNFTVKEPGENSFFDFHLDWNMVDESIAHSVTIWCPLEDVNPTNGNLWVLDKSHTLGDTFRCGPGLALYYTDNVLPESKAQFVKQALQLKAGEAVIYTHKLWHGSPPNLSDKTRIAINQAMMPSEIPSWHYCMIDQDTIGVYEVDDDYYHRCIIDQKPADLKLINQFTAPGEVVQQDQVNHMILQT